MPPRTTLVRLRRQGRRPHSSFSPHGTISFSEGESLLAFQELFSESSHQIAQEKAYATGKLSLETIAVDSSLIDSKKGGESARYNGHKHRKGVKAHAAVSTDSIPLAIIVGAGNKHDSQRFVQVVSGARINIGRGRPRGKPGEVLADAAYDTEAIRSYLRRRWIRCSIPSNKRNQKKPQRGRPTRFDETSYRERGAVE
jgi:hypothetical protein